MTIHSDHPFVPPDDAKALARRLRGRLAAPVTVVAAGSGRARTGLTVSSLLLVDGDPARLVVTVDPDSALGEELDPGSLAAVSLLEPGDDYLAEVFGGLAPAPGGMFTIGSWSDTAWGPRLDARSWCGIRIDDARSVGWSRELLATVEHVEILGPGGLVHARGRFHRLD